MYILYGKTMQGEYKKIAEKSDINKLDMYINKIKKEGYYSYMVKKTSKEEGDSIVKDGKFYKECKVELVDDLKSKVEVKALTFTPSRMKRKEELRKMTENYVER